MTEIRTTPLVLLADDDWMSREVMETQLQLAGYQVATANNGDRVLQLAYERPPDLVLLDVRMDGMTGYDVCVQLKTHAATRSTPVMIVTALESDEDMQRAINSGADDFISKPFTALMLLTRVKNLLRIKQLHDEIEERASRLNAILNHHVSPALAAKILADLNAAS